MYRTDFWTLWEKVSVGWSERIALKHVYYQVWTRSPVQVGCMRQVLRAGALGWPKGMGWVGTCEGGSGLGTHVNPWLIHVNLWQKPLQYCKVNSLQLIKKNKGNKYMKHGTQSQCTGTTQRDGMGREVGGGSQWRDTCIPEADSCQFIAKTITIL